MGIAALVLGIVSLIFGFIPLCGTWAIIHAIVGLILGIIDCVKQSKKEDGKKGKSIAGIVCSALAIVIIIFWWIIMAGVIVNKTGDSLSNAIESGDTNKIIDALNITIDDTDF